MRGWALWGGVAQVARLQEESLEQYEREQRLLRARQVGVPPSPYRLPCPVSLSLPPSALLPTLSGAVDPPRPSPPPQRTQGHANLPASRRAASLDSYAHTTHPSLPLSLPVALQWCAPAATLQWCAPACCRSASHGHVCHFCIIRMFASRLATHQQHRHQLATPSSTGTSLLRQAWPCACARGGVCEQAAAAREESRLAAR